MTISCENRFCVYWEENECIFDDIEINALGGLRKLRSDRAQRRRS